tara:strand:- start:73 stop:264 length:192 start_codon:yes stop_codon:yes gene_type:complete
MEREIIRMDTDELQKRLELMEMFEQEDFWQAMSEKEQSEIKASILTISFERLKELCDEARVKH